MHRACNYSIQGTGHQNLCHPTIFTLRRQISPFSKASAAPQSSGDFVSPKLIWCEQVYSTTISHYAQFGRHWNTVARVGVIFKSTILIGKDALQPPRLTFQEPVQIYMTNFDGICRWVSVVLHYEVIGEPWQLIAGFKLEKGYHKLLCTASLVRWSLWVLLMLVYNPVWTVIWIGDLYPSWCSSARIQML